MAPIGDHFTFRAFSTLGEMLAVEEPLVAAEFSQLLPRSKVLIKARSSFN